MGVALASSTPNFLVAQGTSQKVSGTTIRARMFMTASLSVRSVRFSQIDSNVSENKDIECYFPFLQVYT